MAKELPYFKFDVSEWLNGDISLEDPDVQGIFIQVCCVYWHKVGDIEIKRIRKQFNKYSEIIEYLIEENYIKVNDDDEISINFLDEQLSDFKEIRRKRSEAGKASAEQRKNKKLTSVEQVLNTSATKRNNIEKKREEEKRKEEKRVDYNPKVFSQAVHDCYEEVIKHFDQGLIPNTDKKKNQWLDTIDKLNRIDDIPFEAISELVKRVRQDDFWSSNFQSILKLRKNNNDGIKYFTYFFHKFGNTEKQQTGLARHIRAAIEAERNSGS
jgi:hypothetical protein